MTVAEAVAPPREAFDLSESIRLEENVFNEDGTIDIHVIRPCVGRGKGRHVYEADMLKEHAHLFGKHENGVERKPGWKMYVDHLSEAARRALGGLPRPLAHSGGRVVESWWDDSVPADPARGYGEGAVVAKVKPVGLVKKLLQEDPEIVEASINAKATAVKQVTRGGQPAWLVEGIEDYGSIDWVSEGGAGGRVASLIEAAYHTQEDRDMAFVETLSDEELVSHLRESRPGLVEALSETETTETETTERKPPVTPPTNEEENTEVTTPADALREALDTDEGKQLLDSVMSQRIEEAVSYERDLIRAEANAEADRKLQLRDFRDEAHRVIEATRLPDRFKQDLRESYALTEDGPTPKLDVLDELNDEGEVVKTAAVKLAESVQADIDRQRELVASANPTRVREQGPSSTEELTESTEEEGEKKPRSKKDMPLWERTLQEAGFDNPQEAYE